MSSELITILEKEATAEIERILTEARAQGDKFAADARADAQTLLEAQRQRLEAERKAGRQKGESTAQLRAAALVLQAKDLVLAEVLARAETELSRTQQERSKYAAILSGLIREAAAGLSGRLTVEVNHKDLEIARQALRDLNVDVEVRPTDELSGGTRLSVDHGRLVVENTLTSRLAQAKPLLATEIAALLWGK